jgi:hypothetical protein
MSRRNVIDESDHIPMPSNRDYIGAHATFTLDGRSYLVDVTGQRQGADGCWVFGVRHFNGEDVAALENSEIAAETVRILSRQSRDNDGRYDFNGRLDRICVCGCILGVHCSGSPHDCLAYTMPKEAAYKPDCRCPKFRESRAKKSGAQS